MNSNNKPTYKSPPKYRPHASLQAVESRFVIMQTGKMPCSSDQYNDSDCFETYLQFVSDMLGGDIFPLAIKPGDLQSIVSHRAIDYELIVRIVREVQTHNTVLKLRDTLDPYLTLDALGKIRAHLIRRKGDIHQISLVDRIGELTVSFFNIGPDKPGYRHPAANGKLYRLSQKR